MKIAIIGYSGAGKSTLAKRLAQKYSCPVLHLDSVNFTSGWKERNRDEAEQIVADFLKNPSWVIDGNYTAFCHAKRMEQADKIIFLNLSRFFCFFSAVKRYFKYRGRTREDMAEGCNEKMDFEFAKWLLLDGRKKERRARFQAIIRQYPQKIIELKSRKEMEVLFHNQA